MTSTLTTQDYTTRHRGLRDAARIGEWMATYSGQRFYPLDPRADEMRIIDVAHHLAMQPRYGGACRDHYSVAEHCVIGSYLVPEEHALEFLLHDASEAWLADMIRPIKHHSALGEEYRRLEAAVDAVVRAKWELPEVCSPAVKRIDDAICEAEKRQVFQWYPGELDETTLPDVRLHFWTWQKAEARFMARFAGLTRPGCRASEFWTRFLHPVGGAA